MLCFGRFSNPFFTLTILQFLQFAVIEFSPYKTHPKFLIYKYIKIIFLYLHTPAYNCKL